jgi:hypothetical protein
MVSQLYHQARGHVQLDVEECEDNVQSAVNWRDMYCSIQAFSAQVPPRSASRGIMLTREEKVNFIIEECSAEHYEGFKPFS